MFLTALRVPGAVLLKHHIGDNELGNPGRDRAKLEGGFVGAALQHHPGQLGCRGFGEAGHQNGGNVPLSGMLQNLNAPQGCAGIGKQYNHPAGLHGGGGGKLHIVIVDNGRSHWLADPDHWQMLRCIRCGACMNTCPVYRWSGGYSYSYFIPGPLGVNLGMLRDPHRYSGNVSACTLCLSCQCVCPVKIKLGDQIYQWRQKLDDMGEANKEKKRMCMAMEKVMGSVSLYNKATSMLRYVNSLPSAMVNGSLNPWAYGHKMMKFPKRPFHEMIKDVEKGSTDK